MVITVLARCIYYLAANENTTDMKIYGKKFKSASRARGIKEVAIALNKIELDQLITFLQDCSSRLLDSDGFDHAHFLDFIDAYDEKVPDIVIVPR